MANTFQKALIKVPTLQEEKVITAAAKGDRDARPLTLRQLKAIVPLRTLRVRAGSAAD